jgi:hypothetical protein
MGAELFEANGLTDGRSDITKLRVTFRNFTNTSNNARYLHIQHCETLRMSHTLVLRILKIYLAFRIKTAFCV